MFLDAETGKIIVIAITAVGAVVWLVGLTLMLRVTRERREATDRAADRFRVEGEPVPGTIVGEAEVEGQPEEVVGEAGGPARERRHEPLRPGQDRDPRPIGDRF